MTLPLDILLYIIDLLAGRLDKGIKSLRTYLNPANSWYRYVANTSSPYPQQIGL